MNDNPTKHEQARALITLFDQCREKVWGPQMGRLNPWSADFQSAHSWLEAGATRELCEAVYLKGFETQKARNLQPASCLRYFDNPIKNAVATAALPAEDDPETIRWRSRLKWFAEKHSWMDGCMGAKAGGGGLHGPKGRHGAAGVKVIANCPAARARGCLDTP